MTQIPDAVVVIPSVAVDDLLVRCVRECAAQNRGTEIVVVVDDDIQVGRLEGRATVMRSEDPGIAAKRNQGVRHTSSRYVAFIDSDAYPAPGWVNNAVAVLDARSEVGVVGGPNVSPPGQSGWEWAVGRAHRSILVDGWWRFRKDPGAAARDVSDLPSCNMVVRRTDYEAVGGMNEALFTAEDVDFCVRLQAAGRRIHFTPEVLVYHKDRGLRSFAIQRFTFGVAMVPLLRQGRTPDPAYVAVSGALSAFVLFMGSGPLGFRHRPWRRIWSVGVATYAVCVAAEALRLTRGRGGACRVMLALAIGNLAPGVGVVLRALRLAPDLDGLYRNDS